MNAQFQKRDGVFYRTGIEWVSIFGVGTGYTANPVRGCEHGCEWRMPDGNIVRCYAEAFDDRLHGEGHFKTITFHPSVLAEARAKKERSGIFFDSMSDLLGNKVKPEWIAAVIQCMRDCPQHVFFILTKNPRRLTEFEWPGNALVGLSAPPTFMYGKELNIEQQRAWFRKGLEWLSESHARIKWVSMEPLTVDLVNILQDYSGHLGWSVIGAGSDGHAKYQPDENLFVRTLLALSSSPVFFKGNLDRQLAERHGGWREEWPTHVLEVSR